MKINLKAQNPLEWLALKSGLIPQPILLAHFGFMISKVIGEAVNSGILEAIANKKQTPEAIAETCKLNESAVTALVYALTGLRIVIFRKGQFSLPLSTRKWLLKDSKDSYRWQVLFDNNVCYPWMEKVGDYLKTGRGLAYHQTLQPQEWILYQNGMQATYGMISKLAASKIRLPNTNSRMLDIGGAHGLYSISLLKKYPLLTAEVLDLPDAVAANSDKPNPFPSRLSFPGGDILQYHLPANRYDLIILANVAHHFTKEENVIVAKKVQESLRQGGKFYILEFFKKNLELSVNDTFGALQSFFFSFSSTSGLWTAEQIKDWFVETGYNNVKQTNFVQLPGTGMIYGQKG